MLLYDYCNKQSTDTSVIPKEWLLKNEIFVLCHVADIRIIQDTFGFDESTVLNCTDLDESVRFNSFENYDFISLVHMENLENSIDLYEINMYFSSRFVILVMPDNAKEHIKQLESDILNRVMNLSDDELMLNRTLYAIFHILLSNYSAFLEIFEDDLENLQEKVIQHVDKKQFELVNRYRQKAYKIKKQLRAMSYLGTQILVNSNGFIHKDYIHYFHSIETRLKKLFDFAESLYEMSNQILDSYDSRITMKTNEIVNKLTILTVFFGPLTVITGIYGMNFVNMPELNWTWGYPAAILLMVVVTGIVYWLLKRKKWM